MTEINILPILSAAIIFMAVGMIWYHPKVFGDLWMQELGLSPEAMEKPGIKMLGAAFNALLTAFVLSIFVHHVGADTIFDGACVGFWAWLGFSVTATFAGFLWENKTFKVFLINVGCLLISLSLMGALLAKWS